MKKKKLMSVGFVVYDHPLDYPNAYVAREWFSDGVEIVPADVMRASVSLEELRDMIPREHLVRFDPAEDDDPVILEVWM